MLKCYILYHCKLAQDGRKFDLGGVKWDVTKNK